jgi:hypothetical protein
MILRSKDVNINTAVLLLCFVLCFVPETSACFRKPVVPAWVNTQLSDPNYFIGIGSAPIIKRQNTHIERARKDALNELASEISVQLFSSNVLVTLVRNDKIKDEFNSLIRSRVITEIEGYELVDTYADKKNYWVYYRLPKSRYYEQQRQKRLAATQNALSYYRLATLAEISGDLRNALVNYAKTLDAVRLYLNENIVADINGNEENLVVKSFAGLNNILSSLSIEPQQPTINAIYAKDVDPEMLVFQLKDASGRNISGFPLMAHYSERAMLQPSAVTDANGQVQFTIGKVRSSKREETFRVTPDINAILLESAADFTIRKAILEMPFQTLSVPVFIRKPAIRFEVNERNNGQVMPEPMLARSLLNLSRLSGYDTDNSEVDYICFIDTNTKPEGFNNGIYTVVLTGNIVVTDSNNNIKYTARITPVKGMQLSLERAGAEAYNALLQQINTRYFREIEEAIVK